MSVLPGTPRRDSEFTVNSGMFHALLNSPKTYGNGLYLRGFVFLQEHPHNPLNVKEGTAKHFIFMEDNYLNMNGIIAL